MELIAILIPAAGFGRRMRGIDKLLQPIDGMPLLARQVARACAVGAPVLVTLPANGARAGALQGSCAHLIPVPDAAEGMAGSLRAGARAAMDIGASALMVLPADMPDIETSDLCTLCATYYVLPEGTILQATTSDGRAGHPVILPADLLAQVAELTGDIGARSLLQAHPQRLRRHPLPGDRALTDLDTPEAWAEWHAARAGTATDG
jgi:CTP:molybdopterin cytidylyltransferase MocA